MSKEFRCRNSFDHTEQALLAGMDRWFGWINLIFTVDSASDALKIDADSRVYGS